MELRFDGGLVASRHPLELADGELLQSINGFYMPDSGAISRAPGWTAYATPPAATTANYFVGITGCKMPHNNTTYILTQDVAGIICTASASTATITLATAHQLDAASASGLESVYYDKKWFLFTGQENKVLAPAGSGIRFRQHGMAPVPAPFSATGTAASAFSVGTTGLYEYWFTEVDKSYSDDELESAYGASDSVTVNVTSTTACPTLTFPKPTNPNATHFRIYRSTTTKVASTDTLYPSGYAIGDVPVLPASGSAVVFTDGGTPATVTGVLTQVDSTYTSPGWASATNVTGAPDSNYTRFTRSTAYNGTNSIDYTGGRCLMFYTTTATASGNITGIKADVVLRSSNASKFQVYISLGNRASATAQLGALTTRSFLSLPPKTAFPNGLLGIKVDSEGKAFRQAQYGVKSVNMNSVGAAFSTASLGGQFDDWLPSAYDWTPADLTNNFGIVITVVQQFVAPATGGETLDVDGVTLTFYSAAGSTEVSAQLYDAISVEVDGQPVVYPSHGKPPRASTGVIYEGSLVVNDIDTPGVLAYSLPGFPDYFPGIYQLPLPEPEAITYVGVVNNRLIAATPTKLYRINYLPNEDDASFRRGTAIEQVSSIFGVAHPKAACVLTAESGQEELACASISGLWGTDGFTYRSLTDDVRWAGGIFYSIAGTAFPTISALVNHPPTQTLRLFISDTGNESVSRYFPISYAARHRKPGAGVKWAGPVYCQPGSVAGIARCAAVIPYESHYMVLAAFSDQPNANQRIWREAIIGLGEGTLALPTTDNAALRVAPKPTMLGQGDWGEGRPDGLYLYGAEASGYNLLTYFPYSLSTYYAPRVTVVASQYYPGHSVANTTAETATALTTGFCSYIPLGDINSSHLQLTFVQYATGYQQALLKADLVGQDFGEAEKP